MKFSSSSVFFFFLSSLLTKSAYSKKRHRNLLFKKEKSSKKTSGGGLKMGKKHPNILIIMTDEQRFPTHDDDQKLGQDWYERYLPAQMAMKREGTELVNHYIGSSACTPSRAVIWTGQQIALHGVAYTPGAAKVEHENDNFHLDFNTVPTLGDYFTEGGYRSFFRGKWHIGHADIEVPINRDIVPSSDSNGKYITENRDLYLASQRLLQYGFKDNIGPDAHGPGDSNAGINRDPLVADQAIESLDMLEESDDETPFLLVTSFLNPHDIVLFGVLWLSFGWNYDGAMGMNITYGEPTTRYEDLITGKKPSVQSDYAKRYKQVFVPQVQVPVYYSFYFWLLAQVDIQIKRVWDHLQHSRFKENTIVIFTSDHGDALGSHGGMHQKWHQAYEETTHVPFIVTGPGIAKGEKIDILSNHLDIVPTLLSFANLDEESIRRKLKVIHTEAQPLPGRDLKNVIKGFDKEDWPVYFLTEDDISHGTNQTNALGQSYESFITPNKVEAVITHINGTKWKYVRTFNNSLINPPLPIGTVDDVEEYELYNLNNDPIEVVNVGWDNIGTTNEARMVLPYMKILLIEERTKKLRHPKTFYPPSVL